MEDRQIHIWGIIYIYIYIYIYNIYIYIYIHIHTHTIYYSSIFGFLVLMAYQPL